MLIANLKQELTSTSVPSVSDGGGNRYNIQISAAARSFLMYSLNPMITFQNICCEVKQIKSIQLQRRLLPVSYMVRIYFKDNGDVNFLYQICR